MAKEFVVTLVVDITGKGKIKATTQEVKELGKATQQTGIQAANFDKNLKGVAGNAKNASSQFAKQAQGMGGLVHVYATVAANVWALTAAFQVLKNAADLSIMEKAANDLSISTGVSFTSVAKNMQDLTGGAIGFVEAMRSANLALSGGATASQIEDITVIANKAANALGVSVPNAVNRMIQAVTKGEPELVDELGIILRVTKATEEYADAIGKTANELTTFERQQAIINQLITQGTDKFGTAAARTNPFEKLIASTTDLVRSGLKKAADIIGPIVNVIADNTGLVAVGFGLIASQILKLVIPTLLTTREHLQELATQDSAKAKQAFEDINKSAEKLKKTTASIQKQQQNAARFAGGSSAAGAFKSFTEEGILAKSLDKRSNLGKQFQAIMEDGLKKGLSNAKIFETVKRAKILKKIQSAIASGDTSIFKKAFQNQTGLINDEIATIRQLANAEKKLAALERNEIDLAKRQKIATQQRINALTSATFQQGRLSIAQNTQISQTWKLMTAALSNLNVAYAQAAVGQGRFNRAILFGRQIGQQAVTIFSAIGNAISLGFNKLFGVASTILILVQTLKTFLVSIGVLNKEFSEGVDIYNSVSEEIITIRENYKDLNAELSITPDSLQKVTDKWSKLTGVIAQYEDQIEKTIKQMKIFQEASFLDVLFSFDLGIYAKSLQNLADATQGLSSAGSENLFALLKDLSESTGTPIEFKINIGKGSDIQKQIDIIKSQLANGIESSFRGKAFIEPLTEVQKQLKQLELDKLLELPETFARFNTAMGEGGLTSFLGQLQEAGKLQDFLRQLPKYIQQATKPAKETATSFGDVNAAAIELDSILTTLRNKSESRRVLNADTLISFRDQISNILIGLQNIEKQGLRASANDISQAFEPIPKALMSALMPSITPGQTNSEIIINNLTKDLKALDSEIDTIRNFKSEMVILGEAESRLRTDRGRGSLTAIVDLYDKGTEKIREQVKNLKANLSITRRLAEIVDEDQGKNIKQAEAYEAQLKTKEKELRLREGSLLPAINRDLAANKREVDIYKAQLDIVKQRANITSSLEKATSSVSKNSEHLVTIYKAQTKEASTIFNVTEKLKAAQLEEEKLNLEKLRVAQDLRGHKDQELKINKLIQEQELRKINHLKQQRDLRLQVIEAENRSRLNVTGGFVNSFATFGQEGFGDDFRRQMAITAKEMGEAMADPIKQAVKIFNAGASAITDTLVDGLIEREWDGKEEGRSLAVAIRESLKASLRKTIGDAIKENMNQAIANLVGKQDKELLAIDRQIAALNANTRALGGTASTTTSTSSGGPGFVQSMLSFFSSSNSSQGSGLVGGQGAASNTYNPSTTAFAEGGIVHRPTNALIGEGPNSEAVVPLPDNRSIPVVLEGNSGNTISIDQKFDFRGADPGSEARLRKFAAQIKAETIRDITNSISKGGSMAKTVGRR
jgi:hypothetical protein